jgi:hypothetical protein
MKTLNIMIASLEFIFTFVDTGDFIPPFWWFGFGLKNNPFIIPPIRPPWSKGAQTLK